MMRTIATSFATLAFLLAPMAAHATTPAAAATKLFGRTPEYRSAIDGGGWIYGTNPQNDPHEPSNG